MATNQFERPDYYEHKILDEHGKVVGHVRIKPNKILWCPKNGKKWLGVSIEDFASHMETYGKRQDQ